MVSVIRRMRKLNSLLNIKYGPGAVILPPEVTRIHLDFAERMNGGHMGPRKFWRNCLPRLKFHNPTVPMTVHRTKDQSTAASLTIHLTSADAAATYKPPISSTTQALSSTAPVAASTPIAPTERTSIIDMKNRTDEEILLALVRAVKVKEVLPNEGDMERIRELEEQKVRSDRDSTRMAGVNAAKRKADAVLATARGESLPETA